MPTWRGPLTPVIDVVAVASAAACVLAAVVRSGVEPYLGFSALARDPMVAICFAGAGVLAVHLGARRMAALLVAASIFPAGAGLAVGLRATTSWWILPAAVAIGMTPMVLEVSARGVAMGRRRGRPLVFGAALVAVATAAVRFLILDPTSWGWCNHCAANPLAIGAGPETYVTFERILAGGWVAVGIAVFVAIGVVFRSARAGLPTLVIMIGTVGVAVGLVIDGVLVAATGVLDQPTASWTGSIGSALVAVGTAAALVQSRSLQTRAEAHRLNTENSRLSVELERSLDQVRESRARLVTASEEARRRIERDLHDGAQQLLVSAAMSIRAAGGEAADADPKLAGLLDRAAHQLADAQAELRELAGGLVPAALVHGNLGDALRELAVRSAVPVSVTVTGSTRLDPPTTSTLYFAAAECLTNVAKHAHATSASVVLRLQDPVTLVITDNGAGGADMAGGSGLRGLADRVEGVGGQLAVASSSAGTTVTAAIPVPDRVS